MKTYTLDWNCVIELEEQRPQAASVQSLVDAHRRQEIEVALLAASASENTKSKLFPGNAKLFFERVKALGLDDLPLVPMPAIVGLSYFDNAFWVSDAEEFERLKSALWAVMAPNVAIKPIDHLPEGQKLTDDAIQSEALSKWRNVWCDVISAYSHIHAKRDVFVTSNTKDFQKHREQLSKLGMAVILTPSEAVK